MAISGGFVEVADNRVTVLGRHGASWPTRSTSAGRRRRGNGPRRLRERQAEIDRARAEAALHRALNRLRAARAI